MWFEEGRGHKKFLNISYKKQFFVAGLPLDQDDQDSQDLVKILKSGQAFQDFQDFP